MGAVLETILGSLGAIAGPFAEIYKKRIERRTAKDGLKHKLQAAKGQQGHDITLNDQEQELLLASQFGGTWKDEYALLLMTSFLHLLVWGCVVYAFTGDYRMINGVKMSIAILNSEGVPMGFLITAVICSATGISVWRLWTR